jgi:hypothetical protein
MCQILEDVGVRAQNVDALDALLRSSATPPAVRAVGALLLPLLDLTAPGWP